MYRFFILISLIGEFILPSTAQVSKKAFKSGNHHYQSEGRISAIVLRSSKDLGSFVQVTLNGRPQLIPLDPDGLDFTYFFSLPEPLDHPQVDLIAQDSVTIFLISSGVTPKVSSQNERISSESDCLFSFSSISQSEWRSGLSAPQYSRSFTNVQHVVVHHSAGSNSNSNYTQVVRDIYLYHTEVNGWSDIGYNYLIAQDGTIYDGRDPDTGEQDNVMGAHFCGRNSGTMGICLLGNYQTAQASSASLQSLQLVIAHKIKKESLDPFGQYPHSLGSLPAIIGHRDGCSTACPGENVYDLLNELRGEVNQQITNCEPKELAFSASSWTAEVGDYVTFYNESFGYESYEWLLTGAETEVVQWQVSGSARWIKTGEFPISLVGITSGIRDTLTHENIISVSGPLLFPSLAAEGEEIRFSAKDEAKIETIFSLDGKNTQYQLLSDRSFRLLNVEPGLYLIELTNGKVGRILIR